MSKQVPVPEHKGFKNISLSAQALFFHLWVRSVEQDGRWFVDTVTAGRVRRELGAPDSDVQALRLNGFITAESGRVYLVDRVEWMPGPITEENDVPVVHFIFPGGQMEYWRQSLERYREEQRALEQRHAGH